MMCSSPRFLPVNRMPAMRSEMKLLPTALALCLCVPVLSGCDSLRKAAG